MVGNSMGIVQIRLAIRIILAADIDPEGKLINHPLIDGHNTFFTPTPWSVTKTWTSRASCPTRSQWTLSYGRQGYLSEVPT